MLESGDILLLANNTRSACHQSSQGTKYISKRKEEPTILALIRIGSTVANKISSVERRRADGNSADIYLGISASTPELPALAIDVI